MQTQRHLSEHDATRLYALADQLLHLGSEEADAAEYLMDLVATAVIHREPCDGHVVLDACVTYIVVETGERHAVTLVEPALADAQAARISVLTPVGLALLGLSVSDEAQAALPSGRIERLRISGITPMMEMSPDVAASP